MSSVYGTMCGSRAERPIRSSLMLSMVPLGVGVALTLAATLTFVLMTSPHWMDGVSNSLESEEQQSLSRLSLAQAGFAEEVMGEITDEARFVTGIAQEMWTGALPVSDDVAPVNARRFQLPYASTEKRLNYDTPGRASSACTATYRSNCFDDPDPMPGHISSLSQIRTGQMGSVVSSAVYWPARRSAGETLEPVDYEYEQVDRLPEQLNREIRHSAFLEDYLKGVYEANPAIELAYIGYRGKGTFRTYPYIRATSMSTKFYRSARDRVERQGYDPRHRPWFLIAEESRTLSISPPYEDATTGELVITIAAPVFDVDGSVVAVTGFDVSIAALQKLVLSSKVLREGYAYLTDASGELIVYGPGLAVSDIGNAKVWDKEFGPDSSAADDFVDTIFTDMAAGGNDITTFYQDDGELWHIAYAAVTAANYSLAFVVPDRDIMLPATETEKLINKMTAVQVAVFAALIVGSLVVFLGVMRRVALAVTKPVAALKQAIDLIIHDLHRSQTTHGDVDGEQPFQLHLREIIPKEAESSVEVSKMKESFEYMLMALRFGSKAFSAGDIDGAVKVYSESLAMFEALHNQRGVGISTFNLGVMAHNKYLQSDKKDRASAELARKYYVSSIENGRAMWRAVREEFKNTSHESTVGRFALDPAHCAIEVKPARKVETKISVSDDKRPDTAFVGHDLADKLASRLSHLAQLYVDQLADGTGDCDKAFADAEPLLKEALDLDILTHNILGYAQRVGQMCHVLVGLGRFEVAVETIEAHLKRLRAMMVQNEQSEEARECKQAPSERQASTGAIDDVAALKEIAAWEQRQDELYQALQHGLVDAAKIQTSMHGNERLALQLYIEALTCAERSGKGILSDIWDGIGQLVERHRHDGTIGPQVLKQVDKQLRRQGVGVKQDKDLVFVVDYSGSMSGGKMRRARRGIRQVITQKLDDSDRVALVRFSHQVERMRDLQRKDVGILTAVDNLRNPSGATALWDAIGTGLTMLTADDDATRDPWIVAVTDGADNCSREFRSCRVVPVGAPVPVGSGRLDKSQAVVGAVVKAKAQQEFYPAVIESFDGLYKVRFFDGQVRQCRLDQLRVDDRADLRDIIKQHRMNLVILSVGVDDENAMKCMRSIVQSVQSPQVGELIDIQSSEDIDGAFETISRLVGRKLQVQHY